MTSKFTGAADESLLLPDIIEEVWQRFSPLHGYENLDLVSLEEATDSLVSLIPQIKRMVEQALDRSAAIKSSVPIDERASIMLYTMQWSPKEYSFHRLLNATLRSSNRNRSLTPWLLYLKLFLTALGRLSPMSKQTVFHGVKMDLRDQYPQGSKVVWWGFTSCTTSMSIIEDDRHLGTTGPRTLFAIESHSGKDIHRFSCYPEEKEVLLLSGREFKVVHCADMGNDLFFIRLQEVQSQFSSISVLLPSGSVHHSRHIVETEKRIKPKSNHSTVLSYFDQHLIDAQMQRVMYEVSSNGNCNELDLSSNKITYDGAAIISKALPRCQQLALLHLQYNQIGPYGSEHLADALSKNQTLTRLDLRNNQIEDRGAQYLAFALKSNQSLLVLDLGSNQIGDIGVQYLANALQHNTTLTTLNLQYNEIGPTGAQHLGDALARNRVGLSTLMVLDLASNQIQEQGAANLASGLRCNSSLTKLDLRDNLVGEKGVSSLTDVLADNTTITELSLECNRVGPIGADHLAVALQRNATIKILHLGNNLIGDKGAQYLADALTQNQTLTTLDLTANQIGDKGVMYLALVLADTALTMLELNRNRIGDRGAQALAKALKSNTTLTTLNLRDNQIGDDGAIGLAEALRENTTLLTLEFTQNRIGLVGIQILTDALVNNTTLTLLDLADDSIDNDDLLKSLDVFIQRNREKRLSMES